MKDVLIIYSLTNRVNGKLYIGQTKNRPEDRWRGHFLAAEKGVKSPLCRAIRKHGAENFDCKVIASTKDPSAIDDLEVMLIEQYNTYIRAKNSNGYNQTRGGKGWSSDVVKEMAKTRNCSNYSEAASKRVKKLVDDGTHNWLGNRGAENARKRNAKWVADGVHPGQVNRSCPHCGKTGKGPQMFRYHFDKCANRA
jgi:group I intron endonuclease